MHREVLLVAAAAALMAFGAATVSASEGRRVAKDRVPKAVIESFQKSHPGASVKGYEGKTEGSEAFYEVEYTEGAVTREDIFKADGTLPGTDEDISVKDLPEAVTKAVAAKYPGARIVDAERLTRGGTAFYGVEIKAGGARREVTFDSQGNSVAKGERKD